MKRTGLAIFAFPAILLVSYGAGGNGAAARLDRLFAPIAGTADPGIAVLVRKDGRTVFEMGYGVRDVRTHSAIRPHTNFRLASCTKQFTAMAIMLLVHDGKLRYDEPLTTFFPDFPEYGRRVTIRHLLTHTAGLPDYEELMEGGPWTAERQITDAEALGLIERRPAPKFAAGSNWAYSNSAYVLLGLIVAKVSGEPFGEFLARRIFTPLHMTQTVVFVKGSNAVPNRAFGYSRDGRRFVDTDQSPTSATLGDGGVYSNLQDLARWDAALENHTLLGEEEMRPALAPVTLDGGAQPRWPEAPGEDNLNPGQPVSYGFGWFLDTYEGRPRMWHTGTTSGFRTAIERFPRERLTVIVLCNRTDLDAGALALKAESAF